MPNELLHLIESHQADEEASGVREDPFVNNSMNHELEVLSHV
jgi:hypothetical protein